MRPDEIGIPSLRIRDGGLRPVNNIRVVRLVRKVRTFAPVVMLGLCAGVASAQRSIFTGQVIADSSFDPLPGALVLLVELNRHMEAGADGAFRFVDLPAGEVTVQVRLVGYSPQTVRIRLDGRDSLVRDVLLKRIAPVLPNVAVSAKGDAPVPINLAEFERRRARGEGRYIVPEEMDRARGRKTSDVLRRLPGLYLMRLQNGGFAVSSSRGTMSIARRPDGRCFATIWLDGLVIDVDRPGTPPMNIDELKTDEIAAIEYYPGSARVPPEFGGSSSACGVLAIWTRLR
jgi:hypothetical protein